MSGHNTVDDIVSDFVNNDLATLDNIGGESDSFTLSPNLEQPSPSPSDSNDINLAKRGPVIAPGRQGDVLKAPAPIDQSAEDTDADDSLEAQGQRIPAEGSRKVTRNASASSAASATSDTKPKGFGERFKSLGKRITSSGKK